MQQLKDLFNTVLDKGYVKLDRTGVGTKSVFGYMSRFNLNDGFPIVTLKKTFFRSAAVELLWMIGGWRNKPEYKDKNFSRTNIRYLLDNDVHIWTDWPYKAYCQTIDDWYKDHEVRHPLPDSWFFKDEEKSTSNSITLLKLTQKQFEQRICEDDKFAHKFGELGPVYQKQWRDFQGKYDSVDQLMEMINKLKNKPDDRRNLTSFWNPTELHEMMLPPCFSGSAKVKIGNGAYGIIPILYEGDEIFSDKGNIKSIDKRWVTNYTGEMYNIRPYYCLSFECTPNHPFLTHGGEYVQAKDLTEKMFVGIHRNKKSELPSFSFEQGINKYANETIDIDMSRKDYWYLLGYFLGDGWIIDKSKKIQLSIATKDLDRILNKIKDTAGWSVISNSGLNVKKVECKSNVLKYILSMVGKYADGKHIPIFIENAPVDYINEFLEGYKDSDGWQNDEGEIVYSTISSSIALGIQSLYAKLGKACSIIEGNKEEKTRLLLGRFVNTSKCYNIYPSDKNRFAFADEDYLWVKVKAINKFNVENINVFNFDVRDDHTYVVNNISTHNCHMFHQVWTRELTFEEKIQWVMRYTDVEMENLYITEAAAALSKRALSLQMYQRSSDCFLGVPFDWVFYALLTHMLAEVTNMVVDEFIWVSGDTHLYTNQWDAAKEILTREPHPLPKLKIKHRDNIEDFVLEDFELINYKFHPAIKVAVAV